MNKNAIIILLSLVIVLIAIFLFLDSKTAEDQNKINVRSEFNGQKYLVYNSSDSNQASYILGDVETRLKKLQDYLIDNVDDYPEYKEYILRLKNNLNIFENLPRRKYTSYTVDKKSIGLCLRSAYDYRLHDANLVTYVAIHELAHIACPEYDHTDLFKKIFAFFLRTSIELGIYKDMDFVNNPTEYCGMIIDEQAF